MYSSPGLRKTAPKRVLFLADVSLFEPSSGAEQVLYQEATGLSASGMDVFAITRATSGDRVLEIRDGRIREFRYSADPEKPLSFFMALLRHPPALFNRLQHNQPFDIVVCHQPYTAFSLLIHRRLIRLPMIYEFHSPSHEEYLLSVGSSIGTFHRFQAGARRRLEGYCIRKADRIVVLSKYTKDMAIRYHGVSPGRISIIPGGADVSRFQIPTEPRDQLKHELGLPEGRIHLLTVRNLEQRMGIETLIEAIRRLNHNEPVYHLTIGGSGPLEDRLERLILRLGLGDQVSLIGFIPSEELPRYYAAVDYFILPTAHLEGFGLVTPEAMACGTPVLGTPVGGTREILYGFDADLLFSGTTADDIAMGIDRTIRRYQNDQNGYQALRDSCRSYVEAHYTWENHVAGLRDHIIACCEAAPGKGANTVPDGDIQ